MDISHARQQFGTESDFSFLLLVLPCYFCGLVYANFSATCIQGHIFLSQDSYAILELACFATSRQDSHLTDETTVSEVHTSSVPCTELLIQLYQHNCVLWRL